MPPPIHRPNTGKPWTEEENATLRDLAGANTHPRAIADRLGRSLEAVSRQAAKLGVGLGRSALERRMERQDARLRSAAEGAEDDTGLDGTDAPAS